MGARGSGGQDDLKATERGLALALCVVVLACASDRKVAADSGSATPAARSSSGVFSEPELEKAATEIVAFLQTGDGFDSLRIADTVVLYVTPEGGGGRSTIKREQLRDRSRWEVRSGQQRYAIAPPRRMPAMTTKVGRHINCMDYDLATRYPDLAKLPHVGVKLAPDSTSSCLQSWNVTFVFDSNARPPRLMAAVYDQWEW
jgi:hypothetical protein